jgi:hypothetical protein
MNDKDRKLLSIDLSGRINYDVIVCFNGVSNVKLESVSFYEEVGLEDGTIHLYDISEIKPYLYPLSSMTEEQKKEFKEISKCEYKIRDYGGFDSEGVYLIEIGKCEYKYDIDTTVEEFYFNYEVIDWLNKNHFDYRGLISKGLAIDATNLNIY